jgi:hypothetical protein
VIEQAGVQADIAKLERLEAAHRDDQWRLRRAAESARREGHGQRRLEATHAVAIRRRIDTSGDKFRIEIDATTYTSRVDAGKVGFPSFRGGLLIADGAFHSPAP